MTQELQTINQPESTLATADPVGFALSHGASVEAIQCAMAVRRELKAEAAKEAFVAALAAFQKATPAIIKRKAGYKAAYHYATLDAIIEQVTENLHANGLSYSFTTQSTEKAVTVFCKITHSGGHSEVSEYTAPIDDNSKNLMTSPQRSGGAYTFAKRYAFCGALGIVLADDNDAQAPKERHGEARTQTAPAQPQMTQQQIQEALHLRIWNRMSPLPQFKGKTDDETYSKIDKWIIGKMLMEPSEAFENLPNARLSKIAEAVEEEFEATF